MSEKEQGMQDLAYAAKEKQTDEHTVIDEAIRDQAEGYTVFSVPVGVLFRPSDAKIKNAQKKDYLGQAKLIAATDAKDGFTGFTGAEIKKVTSHIETSNRKANDPVRSPTRSSSGNSNTFATHQMVKTNLVSSKSTRSRAASDTSAIRSLSSSDASKGDKFRKPFPVNPSNDRDSPTKNLPPTPPYEREEYALRRSQSQSMPRSRSQPPTAPLSRASTRSSGSSDYTPPPRPRLDTVRDEDYREATDMRRSQSMNAAGRREPRRLERQPSRREIARDVQPRSRSRRSNEEAGDVYDVYDEYYDERPPMVRSATMTRRPLARALTRSRQNSVSRTRRLDDEDEYNRYSDGEDDEFEMITPKRTEITKVQSPFRIELIWVDQSQSQDERKRQDSDDPNRHGNPRILRPRRRKIRSKLTKTKTPIPR